MLARTAHPFARLDRLRHHQLVRPVVAALLLAVGAALILSAGSLLGRRDAAATFMPDREVGPPGTTGGHALTLPLPAATLPLRAELAARLDDLQAGPFGVALGRPAAHPGAAASGGAAVLIDAAAPPLRIEIMGLAAAVWTAGSPAAAASP